MHCFVYVYCSTCFGQHCAHHQELPIAQPRTQAKASLRTEQGWKKHRNQHHTVTSDCMYSNRKLLMMGTVVPETCRAI
jgi:hypothetical protein